MFISPLRKDNHAQLYVVPFSPWPFFLSRSLEVARHHHQLSARSPRYGGSQWGSGLVSSQDDTYPRGPVFYQATSGVLTNSLINIMQSLPGTEKMPGADRFLAVQESGRKADLRAVKHCRSCRGDPGYTLPGVAFSQGM